MPDDEPSSAPKKTKRCSRLRLFRTILSALRAAPTVRRDESKRLARDSGETSPGRTGDGGSPEGGAALSFDGFSAAETFGADRSPGRSGSGSSSRSSDDGGGCDEDADVADCDRASAVVDPRLEVVCGMPFDFRRVDRDRDDGFYTGQIDASSHLPHGAGTWRSAENSSPVDGGWFQGHLIFRQDSVHRRSSMSLESISEHVAPTEPIVEQAPSRRRTDESVEQVAKQSRKHRSRESHEVNKTFRFGVEHYQSIAQDSLYMGTEYRAPQTKVWCSNNRHRIRASFRDG